MTLPDLNLGHILAAAAPLLVVLYLMLGRNWGGSRAGPVGWIVAIVISVLVYGVNTQLLAVAMGRALLLAFFVLYIIWMAILLYHVVNEAGAIAIIGQSLPGLAQDRSGQALLLGWVFGSFLQGASGFGVPAAVVAPLLVSLGFSPNPAVVIALVGHAWAVTYGSLGSSFFSLVAATGEAGKVFAGSSTIVLGFACLFCGLAVLWEAGKMNAIKKRWKQLLVIGSLMAVTQYVLAVLGLYSLAAFGAGMVGLLAIIVDLRIGLFVPGDRQRRTASRNSINLDNDGHEPEFSAPNPTTIRGEESELMTQPGPSKTELIGAMMPYLLLTLIVIAGQLIWKDQLSIININPIFPAVSTRYGWQTPPGPGRSISLLGHAGALLFYTCVLSYLWFKWRGTSKDQNSYNARVIVSKTIKGSGKATIGIISLVALAVTMQHAGMTQILALALSRGTSSIFPFISPYIGALGAFMTGSNTNSNVVFGSLQLETALAIGTSTALILATQTAGGAIGSLFAPAKVIVGCSTVSGAEDNQVLKRATFYGLAIVTIIGIGALVTDLLLS